MVSRLIAADPEWKAIVEEPDGTCDCLAPLGL